MIVSDNCGTVLGVNWRREVDKQNDEAMPHMDYKHLGYSPNKVLHQRINDGSTIFSSFWIIGGINFGPSFYGIYVLHHIGLVHGDWRFVNVGYSWPRDTTVSMDRHQMAATVSIAYGTATPSQREGGQDSGGNCIVGCNAKPRDLLRN